MSDFHSCHPWALLPMLVEAKILTPEQARDDVVLAHKSAHRRALEELHALLPELFQSEDITPAGAERIRKVVLRAQSEKMPDL